MNLARAFFYVLLVGAIGLVGYQIGISQNVAAQIPAGAVAPVAYPYWYGPHLFGLGFLGFLFPLFFLFLVFGLMRAAFGGRGGWGGHRGGGWTNGRERIEQIHRELHGEKPMGGGPTGTTT
jgi:hypothetical protein